MHNLDFSTKTEHEVEIYHAEFGLLGEGQLSFGKNSVICIRIFSPRNFKTLPASVKKIYAKTKNGRYFTLFECDLEDSHLYSRLIVAGKIEDKASRFQIKFSDISEWFLSDQYISGTLGEDLKWENPAPQVSVSVGLGHDKFTLKTETFSSLTRKNENHILNEYTCFIFERTEGEFSTEEIRKRSFELAILLSILIAKPVSISNAWADFGSSSQTPFLFPSFVETQQEISGFSYDITCLTARSLLDDRWQSVFDRYYSSCHQENFWPRLSGMQRYEGFWDFRILGYVSLLDYYVSKISKNNKKKIIENKKLEKFLLSLKKLNSPLTNDLEREIETVAKSIFLKPRDPDFREKYLYAKNLSDPDVLRVINITDSEFSLIKEIRDKIAHGHAPDLSDTSHQEIYHIIDKIALLMTYWSFTELGFSSLEFLNILKHSFNHLKLNPKLDKIHLDRATNSAEFIEVPMELLKIFLDKKAPSVNPCFTQNEKGEISYSEKYSNMYKSWILSRTRKSNDITDAFELENQSLNTVGRLYLEHGEKIVALDDAYIIRDNDSPTQN